LRRQLGRGKPAVKLAFPGDVKARILSTGAVIGEVPRLLDQRIEVDRPTAGLRAELRESLQHALADDEIERQQLSKALLPHVRRFYAGIVAGLTALSARMRGTAGG
jgi:hypothetical protein